MKEKNDLDRLLEQGFQDDLPEEVEERMKMQLNRFREKLDNLDREEQVRLHTQPATGRGLLDWLFDWSLGTMGKHALAFASIFLVVMGGLMQVKGSTGVFADSVSSLGTAAFAHKQIRHAESMTFSVQLRDPDGTPGVYTVHLNPRLPGGVRVRLNGREIGFHKPLERHLMQAVSPYLSASGLVEQLKGKWVFNGYRQQGDCEWGVFTVEKPGETTKTEVTVDMCTLLPVIIKK